MDVKEAIEVINHAVYVDGEIIGANEEEAWVAIKNELERTRWIPVSERLPTEKDGDKNGYILSYSPDFNGVANARWYHVVGDNTTTHWMPLPSVPQEVDL